MGELHFEIVVDLLRREHKIEVVQGKLQVAYRETIQKWQTLKVNLLINWAERVNMVMYGLNLNPWKEVKVLSLLMRLWGVRFLENLFQQLKKALKKH